MPAIPIFPSGGRLQTLRRVRDDRVNLLLEVARSHPQLARLRMGVFSPVVVSSPELAHEILVEKSDHFVKSFGLSVFAKPLLGEGLLTLEHQAHRTRRRMVAPAFMPKHIAGYAAEMVARADRAAERIAQLGETDIAEETMRVTLDIVGKTLFDAEVSGDAAVVGEALTEAMDVLMRGVMSAVPLPPVIPTPANLRGRRATRRLNAIVYRMIAERRATLQQNRSDLLSLLLSARDEANDQGLSDHEVRDEAMTLFLAGHETTANALAWALYLLAQQPVVRARLEAEVDAAYSGGILGYESLRALPYCAQVVKETLRLIPPVYMVTRRVERAVEIGGYQLPRNSIVIINILGIQRHAQHYPDPERFDPDRFSPAREARLPKQAFLPFSSGPRVCIGNHFAMMEAQLVLASWVHALRFELVSQAAPDFEPLLTLRPRGGIPMRVYSRTTVSQPKISSTFASPAD
jgi:cytochrome P450